MRFSVISLFYNRLDVSRPYLDHWRKNLAFPGGIELIFGDSGSTDGTREAVRSFQGATVVEFSENLGFSRGNNHLARRSTGEWLIFLNNDTIPCVGWLQELNRVVTARPDAGMVGTLQYSVASRLVDHAGVYFDLEGKPYHFRPQVGVMERVGWAPVPAITGAGFAIRRELFQQLGGFDESFVNGYEDTDLCLRVRETGKEILLATRSQIWHYVASSPGRHLLELANEKRYLARWSEQARVLAAWTPPILSNPEPIATDSWRNYVTAQVFWPVPQGYNELDSHRFLVSGGRWSRHRIPIPGYGFQDGMPLRVDPAQEPGEFRIGGVEVWDAAGCLVWMARGHALRNCVRVGGTAIGRADDTRVIDNHGNDPQWELSLPPGVLRSAKGGTLSIWLGAAPAAPERVKLANSTDGAGVLVDLTSLSPGGANGGIKVLIFEILRHLPSRLPASLPLVLVHQAQLADELAKAFPNLRRIEIQADRLAPSLETELAKHRVLYAPLGHSALRRLGLPAATVIVDLLHRDRPDLLPRAEVWAREARVLEWLLESKELQVNSDFVARSLAFHYGVEFSQMTVVYNALQHRVALGARSEGAPYFLYPANTWPHKNHENLLLAYQHHCRQFADAWPLILTGYRVGGDNEGLPASVVLPRGVSWRGHLSDDEYRDLLAGAGALVFPSRYEGFGIPVLEALARGVPVICSRSGSLPEVAGECALYCDAESPAEISSALALMRNQALRQRLAVEGVERAKLFCWDREVSKLAKLLERVARS